MKFLTQRFQSSNPQLLHTIFRPAHLGGDVRKW